MCRMRRSADRSREFNFAALRLPGFTIALGMRHLEDIEETSVIHKYLTHLPSCIGIEFIDIPI